MQYRVKLKANPPAPRYGLRWALLTALVAAFGLLLPASASAQGLGRISGVVADGTGAVIPGATVTATQTQTGVKTTVQSNESGAYVFPSLAPALYNLEVSAQGFARYVQQGILLQADQALTQNVALKAGATTEMVTVNADAMQVDTTTGTLSQVVDTQRVNELPLNGRNAAALTTLVAGVVVAPNQASDQGVTKTFPVVVTVTANGSRANQNNYMLDGGNNVDEYTNVNAPFPFPDATQEFSVQTSNYSAEYGQNAGAVVNVITKSGSNQIHGDLFEYNRNAVFNAANYFGYAKATPSSPLLKTRDPLKRNQFGGTIGGPAIKDKLFGFFGYQRTIIRTAATGASSSVLPTPAQLNGQFSTTVYDPSTCTGNTTSTCTPFAGNVIPTSRFNAASLALLKYLPKADATGQVLFKKPVAQDFGEYVARADYALGPRDHAVVRYYLNKFHNAGVLDLTNLLTYADGSDIHYHNALISETHTFSSNVLNNFIASYQIDNAIRGPVAGGIDVADLGVNIWQPAFKQINGIGVSGDFSLGDNPHGTFQRANYTFSDDLRVTKGNHSMAFGAHFEISKIDINNQFQQPGTFNFGTTAGDPMASFLMGYLSSFNQASGQFYNNRGKFYGFYAQDSWKATKQLTLNYGVRYEPFVPWHEKLGRIGQFNPTAWAAGTISTQYPNAPAGLLFPGDPGVPTDGIRGSYMHFMPRLGFAYDVFGNGRTAIRGGAGMFYDTRLDGVFNNAFSGSSPFVTSVGLSYLSSFYLGNTTGNFINPYAGKTANPFPAPQPPPATTTFPTQSYITFDPSGNFPVPVAYEWNLAVEQQIATGLSARLAYVGSHNSHNFVSLDINPTYNSGPNAGKRVYQIAALASNQYGSQISQTSMIGNTSYDSLQASLEQRVRNGLSVLFNYTWSKALDDLPLNNGVTSAGAGNSYVLPVYAPNYKQLDYGPSDFNHANVISGSYVWTLPTLKDAPLALRLLANGWQTTGLVQYRTGDPLTVVSGVNNSNTGLGRDRAVVSGPAYGNTACAGLSTPCRGYLLPSSFSVNPSYASNPALGYGNVQKGSFVGPHYIDWDAAIHRYFAVTERAKVQFRAEYFNVLNHTNFGDPATSVSSSSFGRITGTNGDPRIGQLSLKVEF
ncbi:MAG: TonB-dependent receptor [Acidobacteriota bacterium]|nr:TonB-dependent receptor [Acidobacteriota bacterium]